ncbi:hypothetical protein Pmani_007670 [Petrolisthes manimaculis]|uniref:Uncharacterized protein n=1 Tax=Petrolisthes manimaculis TaxID=1843537 RepID=A0AAE1Q8G1_9EUCA|nr:hypothetical protein Pmani_007670 [Petrolisthes manimaculis]
MSSTVQLDITHLTLPPINLTADDVQAKFVTFKGSFQQEVKKIHNTPSGSSGGARPKYLCSEVDAVGGQVYDGSMKFEDVVSGAPATQ